MDTRTHVHPPLLSHCPPWGGLWNGVMAAKFPENAGT